MFRQITLILLICLFFASNVLAGSIAGVINSEDGSVPYANVGLVGTTYGTAADADGRFLLENISAGDYQLSVSAVGYETWTRSVTVIGDQQLDLTIMLKAQSTKLDEIVITGTMKESYVRDSPIKVEVLTPRFFQANPTNNIMEAIQIVNGVQEQINCGVCGTNDIHINGMEGPYTLVMIDGMPIISALSSVYGFNGIPTELIQQVEIVKGPASSLYGTEAVGGVINIITKDPKSAPRIGINTFYTSHRELNLDVVASSKLGKRVNSMISANYYRNQWRVDDNNDNFTDFPLNNRISVFNRWSLDRKDNRVMKLAGRFYYEDRFGGTLQWQPEDRTSASVYGESIYTGRMELIGSYQLPIKNEHIRLDYSYNYHQQNSYYGDVPYIADQSILFGNLIWDKTIKSHDLLLGGTYRFQTYDDNTTATPEADANIIPGLFVQDEFKWHEKSSLLGGFRVDHHQNHGLVFTPRLAVKYKPGEWSVIRLNAGKGFRLVNLFTEDHAALTGARDVVIRDQLKPEESYNANLNYNQTYQAGIFGMGTLDIDFFYTYFLNKIIPDYTVDPNLIVYDNLNGYAISRGVSFSTDHQFEFPLKIKAGVTYQEVFDVGTNDENETVKSLQEFAPKWSGTFATSYRIKRLKLLIDYTGKIMGPQQLPVYEPPFERNEVSPWYSIQNLQVTKELKHGVNIYTGVKNLLNWTQPSPLVNPEDPFSDSFDTAYAYGPVQTRRFYIGLRWSLY